MKYQTSHLKLILFFLTYIIIINTRVFAQPADMGGDVDVPIDGGLSVLLAAGIGYRVKKMKRTNRK